MSLYRLIDEESDRQPDSRLCRTLGVTRSGYYDWQRQPLSDRALANWLLTEQIRGIFDESEQTYGSPRVFKELKLGRGMQIGEKRVARLMSQAGLRSIHAKKRKGSTTRAKEHPLAPDLVGRDFAVDGPDRLWVADFTQLTTWQGTCYVAVVADAYSRLCLGWSVRTDKTSSSKHSTWRSGGAVRCALPARSSRSRFRVGDGRLRCCERRSGDGQAVADRSARLPRLLRRSQGHLLEHRRVEQDRGEVGPPTSRATRKQSCDSTRPRSYVVSPMLAARRRQPFN